MDTPETLKPKIMDLLKKHGKMSLGELQKALNIKRPFYTEQNQHKMPLNQALIQLRDSGEISASGQSFGDPVFSIKASVRAFDEKIVAKEILRVAKILAKTVKAEDDDWAPHEKKGEWNLIVSKHGNKWSAFLKNPHGGGGGGNRYNSSSAAINAELGRGVRDGMGKDKVWVVIQEYDDGKDTMVQKKTEWHPLKVVGAKPMTNDEMNHEMGR